MNRENVLKVADAIEQHSIPDLGFNMESFLYEGAPSRDRSAHKCGTTACIGGWAFVVRHGSIAAARNTPIEDGAREFLGLDGKDAFHLFYPGGENGWDAGPRQAVAVLRHLAETGEVDWSVAASLEQVA